jgi:signal transduction histidine kinase
MVKESKQRQASILLVEDDKAILEGIADLLWLELGKLGYEPDVRMAEHGVAALSILNNFTPDLIISDIMMPIMGGYVFKEKVQTNPAWVHIPFFFLTAQSDRQAISEGHRSGVERYITKPFDTNELVGQVKTQLELNHQRRMLHQEQFDSLKRDFTWMINHELRTPLTYVSAYFELLKESIAHLEDTGYSEESLRGIQGGCVRLIRLVENFIRVIDIRTGEAQKGFQASAGVIENVSSWLRTTTEAQAKIAAASHITFTENIPDNLPSLWGNRESLTEIIERLLDNAIKFTRIKDNKTADKIITVSAWSDQGQLIIQITDTGVGFPGYASEQIFELFYQHNRSHLEQQGSGTGLSIVKGLVNLHRGRIDAQSEEGIGSTFTITLPAYIPGLAQNISEQMPPKKPVTLLIIEDDPHLLDGLADILELPYNHPYHFNIIRASNGQEGLKRLEKTKPDLIISDIMMPIMDGYAFYQHVRENPNWLHIPFIFLTARGERKDIYKGQILGAEDYITKPYDNDDLVNRVVARLNRYFEQQKSIQHTIEEWKRVILHLLEPDITNPILSVSTYSQRLSNQLQQITNEEELKEPLLGIQAGSQQLTRLIENFIALTELKTGETAKAYHKLREVTVEIPLLLCEAIYECQSEADEVGITLHTPDITNSPPVIAETSLLRRLFSHTLRFFIIACTRQTCQHIYTFVKKADHDKVEIVIEMPQLSLTTYEQALIEALFSRNDQQAFRQLEYGPGLTIVKGLTDLHNGLIELEQDDAGCRLCIQMPIYDNEMPDKA